MPPKKSPATGKPSTPRSKAASGGSTTAIPHWQARLEERVAFTYDPSIEDIASTKTYHEYLDTLYPTEAAKCAESGSKKTYAQIYTSEDLASAIQAAWEEGFGSGDDLVDPLIKKMQESYPLRVSRLEPAYSHRPSRIISIREGTRLPDTLVMWAAFDFVLLPTHALLVHILKLHCRGGDGMTPPQRRPRAISADTERMNRVYEIVSAIPVKHCFLEGMHFIHPKDVTAKYEKELDTFVFQSIVDATHFSRTANLVAERQGLGVVTPCYLNSNPARLECYCNPLIGFGLASRVVLLRAVNSVETKKNVEEEDIDSTDGASTSLNGDVVVMGMGGNVVCNALVDTFLNPFSPEALKAAMAAVTSSTGSSAVTISINRVKQFLEDNPLFRIHVVEIEPAVFDACVDAGVAPDTQMPQSRDLYTMLSNVPKRSTIGSLKKAYVIRPQDLLENECHFQSGNETISGLFNEARNRVVFHIGVDALATSPTTGQSIIADRIAQLKCTTTTKSTFVRKYSATPSDISTVKFIFMDCYDPVVSTMVHPTNVIQMLKPLLHPKGGMLIVNTHVSTPELGTQQDRNKETAAAFVPFAEAFPFAITTSSSGSQSSSNTTARITDSLVVIMRNTGLSQHLVSCMRYDAFTPTALTEPQQLEMFAKQHTMEKLSSAINEMAEGNTPMSMAMSQLVGRVLMGTPSSIASSHQAAVSKIAVGESIRSKSVFKPADVSFLLNTLWGVSKGELVLCKVDGSQQRRRRIRVYTSI